MSVDVSQCSVDVNRMRASDQLFDRQFEVPAYSCSGSCVSGNSCACDVDQWQRDGEGYCCRLQPGSGCPAGCSLSTATQVGNGTAGGFVCEAQCTEQPEGAGAAGEDLHIFVTVEDAADCQASSTLLAYASSCAVDQCDRPIFGLPDELGGVFLRPLKAFEAFLSFWRRIRRPSA